MKSSIIITLAIIVMLVLTGCKHLAGVRFGACYEDVCVSVTLPQPPPIIITESGK